MKKIGLWFVVCGLWLYAGKASAQKPAPDSSEKVFLLGPTFAFQVPGGDLVERFGNNFNVGGSFMEKLKSNWLFGIEGQFIFGDQLKESGILDSIRTQQGFLIGTNGGYANVFLYERGFHFFVKAGKFFPAFHSNLNSGIMTSVGVGLLQHKIRIENDDHNVPQVNNNYVKGYDRLTNGLSITEYLGWIYLGRNRIANFSAGFEFTQAFTKNRRSFNFDEMRRDDTQRLDLLFGFRVAWYIPFYEGKPKEFYYN
jgi:hypothetical protein